MRQFIDRLSIRSKIIAGNALLLALFVLGLGIGLALMNRVAEATLHLRAEVVPTLGLLGDIHGAGARLLAEIGNYATLAMFDRAMGGAAVVDNEAETASEDAAARLVAGERAQMGEARERLRNLFAAFDVVPFQRELDDRGNIGSHAQIYDVRRRLGADIANLLEQSLELERLAGSEPYAQMLARLETLEATEELFEETIHEAKLVVTAEAEALQTTIDRRLATALAVSVVALLAGIALVAAGSLFTARRIAGPIIARRDVARRLGAGDLGARPVRSSADEIGELEGAFASMADDLEDSIEHQTRQSRLAGLGELAGTVNHELRNPLSTISNTLLTLRRTAAAEDAEALRLIDRIDRNAERCIDIVSDFLDFARPPVAAREPMAFDPWLGAVLDEYELPASLTLERALDAPVMVALDGERFRRVVGNLLDNAVQALTDGAWQPPAGTPRRITVGTSSADGKLLLSVADTGPGILPEHMGKIFEPLFTTKSFGIGLGLSAVQRIVQQHDGTVGVEGIAGTGVCFTIRLPLAEGGLRGAAA